MPETAASPGGFAPHTPDMAFATERSPDASAPASDDSDPRTGPAAHPDVSEGFWAPTTKTAGGGLGERRAGERWARLDPGRPGARALAVVGLLAVLLAGGYLWASRPRPQPLTGEVPAPSTAASPTILATSAPTGLVVHVAGKVRKPGVVTLPAGARVADAIQAAGGLRADAGTGSLNLARRVVDGEQLMVGLPAPTTAMPQPGAGPAGSPATGAPAQPLDLNSATVEQFDALPGVGPVLAQRIIEYRTRHGGFRSVEQLQDVSGIGARRYAELRPLVRV